MDMDEMRKVLEEIIEEMENGNGGITLSMDDWIYDLKKVLESLEEVG